MAITRLTQAQCAEALGALPQWSWRADGLALERHLNFADFNAAFTCMTRIALYAERHDHHPEWHNVYNRLHIVLQTHEAGGVTQRDLDMARFIESIV